jgi:hypothetical protein
MLQRYSSDCPHVVGDMFGSGRTNAAAAGADILLVWKAWIVMDDWHLVLGKYCGRKIQVKFTVHEPCYVTGKTHNVSGVFHFHDDGNGEKQEIKLDQEPYIFSKCQMKKLSVEFPCGTTVYATLVIHQCQVLATS